MFGRTTSDIRDRDVPRKVLYSGPGSVADVAELAAACNASLANADLRGEDLSGRNLARLRLDRADLRGAHLEGACLDDAHLEEADLGRAEARGVTLNRADLRRATLVAADLEACVAIDADFTKSNLSKAVLSSATLTRAALIDACLRDARLVHLVDAFGCNLRGADLSRVRLQESNLDGAILEGANLHRASLAGCSVAGASFVKANLAGADLTGVDLAAANTRGAVLEDAHTPQRVDDEEPRLTRAARLRPVEALIARGEFDRAFTAIGRMTAEFGDSAVLSYFEGLAHVGVGALDYAANSFARAAGLNPRDPRYATQLGIVCGFLGRWEEASDAFNRAGGGPLANAPLAAHRSGARAAAALGIERHPVAATTPTPTGPGTGDAPTGLRLGVANAETGVCVTVLDRLDRAAFLAMAGEARRMGGPYATDRTGLKGFVFATPESAEEFVRRYGDRKSSRAFEPTPRERIDTHLDALARAARTLEEASSIEELRRETHAWLDTKRRPDEQAPLWEIGADEILALARQGQAATDTGAPALNAEGPGRAPEPEYGL